MWHRQSFGILMHMFCMKMSNDNDNMWLSTFSLYIILILFLCICQLLSDSALSVPRILNLIALPVSVFY